MVEFRYSSKHANKKLVSLFYKDIYRLVFGMPRGPINPKLRRSFGTMTIPEIYTAKNFSFLINSCLVNSYGFMNICFDDEDERTATSSDPSVGDAFLIFHMNTKTINMVRNSLTVSKFTALELII